MLNILNQSQPGGLGVTLDGKIHQDDLRMSLVHEEGKLLGIDLKVLGGIVTAIDDRRNPTAAPNFTGAFAAGQRARMRAECE